MRNQPADEGQPKDSPAPRDRLVMIALIIWVVVLLTCGGASREDEIKQVAVRLTALLVILVSLWSHQPSRQAKPIFVFLAMSAALVAAQLVPLPYSFWTALPGRGFYAAALKVANVPDAPRPMSLAPDLTWNALLALLPAFATACLATTIPALRQRKAVIVLLALIVVGMGLGVAQIAAGPGSALRLYRITNENLQVGFFSNRNHHAMTLAIGILLIGNLSSRSWPQVRSPLLIPAMAVGGVLLLLLAAIATGSRAGFLLSVLATGLAVVLFVVDGRKPARHGGVRKIRLVALAVAPLLVVAIAVTLTVSQNNATAFDRLVSTQSKNDSRVETLEPLLQMTREFLPLGTGFGAFEPTFRRFEPLSLLDTSYINEAHNDLLQILIEGGVAAALLLVLFMGWWIIQTIGAWRPARWSAPGSTMARLGSAVTGLMLVGSLTDYPLRTPMMMSLFVMACVWMSGRSRDPSRESGSPQ